MITFENFVSIKKPIVLILNDSDKKYSKLIMDFFKGKSGIKLYNKDFSPEKILKMDPKIVIDINENPKTKGVFIHTSQKHFDTIKNVLLSVNGLPFIGKRQANKNKNFELDLFKKGVPYCYIEFPTQNFENKKIISGILKILKRIISLF